MPGICGKVSPDAATPAELEPMLARMRHHDWYRVERHRAAGVALGSIGPGEIGGGLFLDGGGSRVAAIAGEIYDHERHRQRLAAQGPPLRTGGHAEICLRGYEAGGPGFFAAVHGKFVAAIWEPASRRLTLISDRLGMRSLYYATGCDGFTFASEVKAVLAGAGVPREPDPAGIAQFFAFGQLLGDTTLWKGIRLLPAAAWLTYDARDGRLSSGRYWDPRSLAGADAASPSDALRRVETAFMASVDRCTGATPGLGLALSGGLDSRTILAAVAPERPLACVTVGIAGSIDLRLAERLARHAGRPHHPCVLGASFLTGFEDHLRRMVRLTDGQYASACIVMPSLALYRRLGVRVLLRGHGGELMHMDKAYRFSLDREALNARGGHALESWLFRHLAGGLASPPGAALLAPRYRATFEPLARTALRSCLDECAGVEPPDQRVSLLFVAQFLRRKVALSMAKFGSVVEVRLPYVDPDLITALLAAPPGLKLGDRIQAHLLGRCAPALLRVPNANTLARLGAGRARTALAGGALRLLSKLRVPGYEPYERLGLWLRRELRPVVERVLLAERCLDRGVFDPGAVRAVVDEHAARRRNHTYLILAMMAFELGQRELADEEYPAGARRG